MKKLLLLSGLIMTMLSYANGISNRSDILSIKYKGENHPIIRNNKPVSYIVNNDQIDYSSMYTFISDLWIDREDDFMLKIAQNIALNKPVYFELDDMEKGEIIVHFSPDTTYLDAGLFFPYRPKNSQETCFHIPVDWVGLVFLVKTNEQKELTLLFDKDSVCLYKNEWKTA